MRPRRPFISAGLTVAVALFVLSSTSALAAEKVYKFNGSGPIKVSGKEMLVVSVISVADGRKIELSVPNKDATKSQLDPVAPLGDAVKALKSGDWVLADTDGKGVLTKITAYTPKPHELTPTGYTMGTSYKTPNGKAVQMTKLGESVEAVIGTVKTESGSMVPDPQIEKLVEMLNKGDAIDAELTGSGKKMTLVSLAPYKEPVAATFQKSAEAEMDGQKVPAVELDLGGKSVTAIVMGKMQGKKWTPDRTVAAFVKHLKEGAQIMATTYDEGGKTYLRRVSMAKKGAAEPKTSGKEKPEKKGKEADAKK